MTALEWQSKMSAPRLGHADGMVVIYLGERAVVFPSEAAARFFYEAYSAVPEMAEQITTLRRAISEEALANARQRAADAEADAAQLRARVASLEDVVETEVYRRTEAVKRAMVLARTLRKVRESI